MPYTVRKLPNKPYYRVTNTKTGQLYAKATKVPMKLIQAIEANKKNPKKK
jgi:hypothetical protein